MHFNPDHLSLNKLTRSDVKTLVDWAREEGWNPGAHDFDAFWQTDPDGFYGFHLEGELIAAGAIVSYNGEFGFMGLFIVRPEYRSHGIGKKLWYLRRDLLLSRLHEGAIIGMDGVVDMQPFYEKGGFNIAFKDERYECIGRNLSIAEAISPINKNDYYAVADYDRQCFGYERTFFLNSWLSLPESNTFKYSNEKGFQGFAVMRKVEQGYKIGPLFADNYDVAEELYKACLNSDVGAPIYLDIPMINSGAVELVTKYEAKYVFECARMYYGGAPKNDINKVYGITTFELG